MPNFRTSYKDGLEYAPMEIKMCQLASGASWISGNILVKAAGQDTSTQYYADGEVIIPRAKVLSASDVATSGVMASGANYGIIGIAATNAPISFLQTGNPVDITQTFQTSSAHENLEVYGYTTIDPIWMPYSGTAPNVGDWVIPSSGSDGYVEALSASTNPYGYIIIGKVLRVASGSEGPQVWTADGAVPKCLVDLSFKQGW